VWVRVEIELAESLGQEDAVVAARGIVVAAKYRIERMSDEGGMGVVAPATDLHRKESVALTFIRAVETKDLCGSP
jgi:hypothetical protein